MITPGIISEHQDHNNLPDTLVQATSGEQARRFSAGNYVGAVLEVDHVGQNKWRLHYSLIADRMNPALDKPTRYGEITGMQIVWLVMGCLWLGTLLWIVLF